MTVYVLMCKGFEVETENLLRAWSNVIYEESRGEEEIVAEYVKVPQLAMELVH